MQVALLSGLDTDGQKKLNGTKDTDHHLNKLLRLLTVRTESGRDRSGIALVGGPHDPKLDGSATQRYLFAAALAAVLNACQVFMQEDRRFQTQCGRIRLRRCTQATCCAEG